jgi:hypothetical protein
MMEGAMAVRKVKRSTRGTDSRAQKTAGSETKSKVQRRSSYLAIRLSEDELQQLRDTASAANLGPTTYARNLILHGLKTDKALSARIDALEQKVANLASIVSYGVARKLF